MSPPGRPKGESLSAKREGQRISPPGHPKGESLSAKREGQRISPPGRPKGESSSAKREGHRLSPPGLPKGESRSTERKNRRADPPGLPESEPAMRARAAGPVSVAARAARDPRIIQSLARGLAMLEDLILAEQPLRLRDFAARYGIDRAAAFRFLATLEGFGVAQKDAESRAWSGGSRLVGWLAAAGGRLRLVEVVRPFVAELARETGHSGHTAVLSGGQALLVDYVASPAMVTVRNRVGVHEPLYCTAVGKALLAWMPEPERERLVGRTRFERHTARTLTGPEALRAELARVRRDGVAVDDGEYNELLTCLAAPLLGPNGEALGSLGISLVRSLIPRAPRHLRQLMSAVRGCGELASSALAGRGAGR
jgi:IclR family acetate operon transcriptional repressor